VYCTQCGQALPDGARFCPSCGTAAAGAGSGALDPVMRASPPSRGYGYARDSVSTSSAARNAIVAAVVLIVAAISAAFVIHRTSIQSTGGTKTVNARAGAPAAAGSVASSSSPVARAVNFFEQAGLTRDQIRVAQASLDAAITAEEHAANAQRTVATQIGSGPLAFQSDTPSRSESAHPQRVTPQDEDMSKPPQHVGSVRMTQNGLAFADSCAYPVEARRDGETGTVILLVYVASAGNAATAQVETSSGSSVLDAAAVACIRTHGTFTPKRVDGVPVGSWGRMRFVWSFGQ
jgi:TonB family protein